MTEPIPPLFLIQMPYNTHCMLSLILIPETLDIDVRPFLNPFVGMHACPIPSRPLEDDDTEVETTPYWSRATT